MCVFHTDSATTYGTISEIFKHSDVLLVTYLFSRWVILHTQDGSESSGRAFSSYRILGISCRFVCDGINTDFIKI